MDSPTALFCHDCFQSSIDCDCDLWENHDNKMTQDDGSVMVIGGVAYNAAGKPLSAREQDEFAADGSIADGEYDYNPSPWATPTCPMPQCEGGTNVFCLECGEEPDVCFCTMPTDWYCGSCGHDWEFDPSDPANYDPEEEFGSEEVDEALDEILAESTLGCRCDPIKTYWCDICGVRRKTPEDAWTKITKPTTAGTSKSLVSTGGSKYGGSTYSGKSYSWDDDDDWDYWGGWGKDRHYDGDGLVMPTSGIKIYASSHNNTRKPGEFVPDWGLYLDSMWHPTGWRYEYIDWPDMSTPYNDVIAVEAIIEAYERALLHGQKVEVGCIGGHGRTGTVLACMAVLEGLTADAAMQLVWASYCKHAIETKSQEWWIHWFAHVLFGHELPPKPASYSAGSYKKSSGVYNSSAKKPATTASASTPKPGTMCSQGDHYIYWMEGNETCPRKQTCDPDLRNVSTNCQWWISDKRKFDGGDIPEYAHKRYEEWKAEQDKYKAKPTNNKVIDGFVVPAPKKGDKQHNPGQKGGCQCDTCRYRAWGGSVFLTTVEQAKREAQERNAKTQEAKKEGTYPPPPANAPVTNTGPSDERKDIVPDAQFIEVMQKNGTIISVRIAKDFDPLPPPVEDVGKPGERRGIYAWVPNYGWVWEGIAKVPEEMIFGDGGSSTNPRDEVHDTIEAVQQFADAVQAVTPSPQKKKRNKANKRNKKNNKYKNRSRH